MTNTLDKRVQETIEAHKQHGELGDGQVLDCVYSLLSWDDLDNDEKIYCLNELLSRVEA